MQNTQLVSRVKLARIAGWSLLSMIGIGVVAAILVADGIDINLSADVEATSRAMLEAEQRLRAKAHIGLVGFGLEGLFAIALFLLLASQGRLLAAWSLVLSFAAMMLTLDGAVHAMNAAHIGGNEAYRALADDAGRHLLAALQATSDYTSFHLGLVLGSVSKAGFFLLFLRSGYMPKLISGWGLFASCFVAITIVARDFVPMLGHNALTAAFMLSNLVALVSTGLYLAIKGVRPGPEL